ncbi:Uncharacterised protein [Mycobacteroides abscessus subsp. abscessus]|nr:Uncharacterised protein [Mycobacteroides abscessus subsp. abscessus]
MSRKVWGIVAVALTDGSRRSKEVATMATPRTFAKAMYREVVPLGMIIVCL